MDSWLPLLRCPATGSRLTRTDAQLTASNGRTYPIVDGRPILIADEKSLFRTRDFQPSAATVQRRGLRALIDRLPTDSTNPGGPRYIDLLQQELRAIDGRKRLLV